MSEMENVVEKSHDARAIANYILDRAPQLGVPNLTMMQLLKLVYLSHGWSLAHRDEPLVAQNPQAWQYGPVYPHIYKALNKFGGNAISERIKDKVTGLPVYPVHMSDRQVRVIDAVLKSYGNKHAFELSNITHMRVDLGMLHLEIWARIKRYHYLKCAIITEVWQKNAV